MPGKGRVSSTGKLVMMKESIQATEFFIKNRASSLSTTEWLQKHDIHVHVPEGARPKTDLCWCGHVTSLVSAMTVSLSVVTLP